MGGTKAFLLYSLSYGKCDWYWKRGDEKKGEEGFYPKGFNRMSRKNGYSGWLSPLKG